MGKRSFFDTARDWRRGLFLDECADKLQEVVAWVEDNHKAAKLMIEITIKPASKGQGAVLVADKVTAKLPQLPPGETVMFVTTENNLVPNDPRQADLPLKSVPAAPAADLKNVNGK